MDIGTKRKCIKRPRPSKSPSSRRICVNCRYYYENWTECDSSMFFTPATFTSKKYSACELEMELLYILEPNTVRIDVDKRFPYRTNQKCFERREPDEKKLW